MRSESRDFCWVFVVNDEPTLAPAVELSRGIVDVSGPDGDGEWLPAG